MANTVSKRVKVTVKQQIYLLLPLVVVSHLILIPTAFNLWPPIYHLNVGDKFPARRVGGEEGKKRRNNDDIKRKLLRAIKISAHHNATKSCIQEQEGWLKI